MKMQRLRGTTKLLCCCVLVTLISVTALTKEKLNRVTEERSTTGIESYVMPGGSNPTLNWTSSNLGKPLASMLQQCTKPGFQGKPLCLRVPMPTPWSGSVDPEAPLPDYPRPQLRRDTWMNLNGIWSFKSRGVTPGHNTWDEEPEQRIVVPFPVEAPLSGIASHNVNNVKMQYKRSFSIPSGWKGQTVILHFDAVDHAATVHLNGKNLGEHEGGYDRFSFDVTEHLREDGKNDLTVYVFDPTEFAHIPIGKQRLHAPRHPSGIFYTSTSGIWQTVWLEPVPRAHIEKLEIVPDIDDEVLRLTVHGSKAASSSAVKAVVKAKGREVASAEGTAGKVLEIKISQPQLWSPDSPFLYDLDVSLGSKPASGGAASRRLSEADSSDQVSSYFGMRKSSMGRSPDGSLRPMLNNEFVFQNGMLDQGFWPDGLYTPASDKALIFDLELTKSLGFNLLRKHVKVESDRWYYHADRLGVLVWQDMPAIFFESGQQDLSLRDKMQFKAELERIMRQHLNTPSIVQWVIFNEGWGQHDTLEVVKFAQDIDKTRNFDAASGWVDKPIGDLVDMHNYVGPGSPVPTENRAAVLGEYGGLGLRVNDHMWIPEDAFAYEMQLSSKQLEGRYAGLVDKLVELMQDPQYYLSAAVYTELSDVEAEINGFVTYDRQVKKVDEKVLYQANQHLLTRS